ncbi:MAG TPA: squalene--hopene cyclase [Pseudolabrys sp.]|nr:squalene--hopene cyclase [Pseudolabrys sp.]
MASSRTPVVGADGKLEDSIRRASDAMLACQQADGHWVFELEADCTIPAEYVLAHHFIGAPLPAELEQKFAAYLRRIQGKHGGWPLFHDGDLDVSASVKAYLALKAIGDKPDAEHMRRAREAILARGGGAASNVFTRFLLALFGVVTWRSVPVMPVEIVLLPQWFPFHLSKISYWSRTTIVPMLVLQAIKAKARNPRKVSVDELFIDPPLTLGPPRKAAHQRTSWFMLFRAIDMLLRVGVPLIPKRIRQRAIDRAIAFLTSHLNGLEGIGSIFPPMVYAVMMFDALGFARDNPLYKTARQALDRLVVERAGEAYCQPCKSPIWDTGLVSHALLETGTPAAVAQTARALKWLEPLQILDVKGDWADWRPNLRPGGWAFQYVNDYYPDVDDTAVVVMAMDRAARLPQGRQYPDAIARAREWVVGMQSANGGWGAFDADNNYEYLNNIPFADHGALLDPPTEDVSARCVSMLAQLGERVEDSPALARGVEYLRKTQLQDGSWFGRWGMNYIYGTWSVVCALNAAGLEPAAPEMRKAAAWITSTQNPDGGWGEDGTSYKLGYKGHEPAPSTASQTAWAMLALMATGDVDHPALARGVDYLARTQGSDGFWAEPRYTATGFPRVFYLRYHGYAKFFPLTALARYRDLVKTNSKRPAFGM